MFDGFWSGIVGGLFGQVITQWLSRFKYRVIFLVATVSMYVGLYISGIYAKGLAFATQAMLENTFTPVGILVPMSAGVGAVFLAFIGSLNTPKKPGEDDKNSS
ncbi:hypothetical protein [Glaciimonas sp. PAMC28666]|uniref:hypothetical protein n=1 Tax=Glaciimonas sp. PAMC28666 TaxID=2807626 RepID=UPI001963B7AE|nr:hypothetical protein [Glaciimonas sp. PAMC28666]QRX81612.1 hypothetical protein JQN73_15840 [Glaciimonas sp. PAMC28666]